MPGFCYLYNTLYLLIYLILYGFTLIELIVVIAILGILAIIAIPRFAVMRENANESAVISNLTNIQTAAETVAATENKAITSVTYGEATTALGKTPGGPGTTSYNFTGGYATASIDTGIPYPTGGVDSYADIEY